MTADPPDDHQPAGDPGRGTIRVLAGFAGGLFVFAALGGALITLIAWWIAARVPNAHDVTGEFASTPDAWSEVFELVGIATVIALLTGALAVAAVGLLAVAVRNRRPQRRTLLAVLLGPPAVTLAVVGTLLIIDSGKALPVTDCKRFNFDAAALAATDRSAWEPQARGLADCDTLRDLSSAEAQQALGRQPTLQVVGDDLSLHDGAVLVRITADRAWRVEYDDARGERSN